MGKLKSSNANNLICKNNISRKKEVEIISPASDEVRDIDIDLLDAAPPEMNRFPKVSQSRYLEIKMSIYNRGLYNNFVVWKQGTRYMVLSGNNRLLIMQDLLNEYNEDRFKYIPCVVYEENELTNEDAINIINEANSLQRDTLTAKEEKILEYERIIKNRDEKDGRGNSISDLLEASEIGKTKIYDYYNLHDKVIPEIADMFFDSKLALKKVLHLVNVDKQVQKELFDNHKNLITNDNLRKIKRKEEYSSIENLLSIFNSNTEIKKEVTTLVNEEYQDDFKKLAKFWNEDEEFRKLINEMVNKKK